MGVKKILEKGVFVKFRFGKKPFNPIFQKKSSAQNDILKKNKKKSK